MNAKTIYYVITAHPTPKPSELATARRYPNLIGAWLDIHGGVLWEMPVRRVVAFHERHAEMVERLAALGRIKL